MKHGFENKLKKYVNRLFRFYIKGDIKGNIDEICYEASKLEDISQRETIPVVLTKEIADLEQVNPKNVKTVMILALMIIA